MSLISVTVPVRDDDSTVTVTGEQITVHFALTPTLARRDDGTMGLADHGRALTHIPTGRAVTHDMFIDMRRFAHALEELPIPWSTLEGFTAQHAEQVRDLHKTMWNDPTLELSWPKWAGDKDNPAVSLTVHLLDDYLEHANNRYDKRHEMKDALAVHDPELAEKLGTLLLIDSAVDTIHTYGLVYLLSVLHRIAPADADRAARDLANTWEYGDSLPDELLHQWRQELADGAPLQLPGGFPDLPTPTAAVAAAV